MKIELQKKQIQFCIHKIELQKTRLDFCIHEN